MRKTSAKSILRALYKIPGQYSSNYHGCDKQGQTKKLSRTGGDDIQMQCGILNYMLEQKENINGKTGKT